MPSEPSSPPKPFRSWNKGKFIGPKSPLTPRYVWSIRARLQLDGKIRDLALFNLAIDSKLRGCDLVALKVDDVAPHGYTASRATVRQRKTGRPVRFEITEQTRQTVDAYLRARPKMTRQYARLVSEWIVMIGLDPSDYGTHSLRRTKATLIYKKTGNLRAVQLLLGHSKIESTVRYLGVEVYDALAIAEQVDV
jgi:integrase